MFAALNATFESRCCKKVGVYVGIFYDVDIYNVAFIYNAAFSGRGNVTFIKTGIRERRIYFNTG